MPESLGSPALLAFSHLRWDFVLQRPQHLLSRAAQTRRVIFWEEPELDSTEPALRVEPRAANVWMARPHLPPHFSHAEGEAAQARLLDELLEQFNLRSYVSWYYTPMALGFTAHLQPHLIVYDCMDELSLFRDAPRELLTRERELFRRADLVFTGGQSLYNAKRTQHPRVYAFPSSVDKQHFALARRAVVEPTDQAPIPHPRLGFFGVIDERMDLDLVAAVAEARPDWHLVMLGPLAKIDAAILPQRANIHYLGSKTYPELPNYLAGWDVALLPFARNESTRFISPTKTPEYLAGGKPVVSTRITDVVEPYGNLGLVQIADTPEDFIRASEYALTRQAKDSQWLARVDHFLARLSWDATWEQMAQRIEEALQAKTRDRERASTVPLHELQKQDGMTVGDNALEFEMR